MKLILQVVAELVEEHGAVVDTEGETEGSVLHKVDTDIQLGEDSKDGLQVVLRNETEVLGQDGKEGLVFLEDVEGREGTDGGERPDDGARGIGVEEGFDVELYVLVLDRLDSFGVDDAGTIVGQLDGFVVGDLLYLDGVGKVFGVGVEEAGDVFPDGHAVGVEAVGQDGGAIVAAFTPEGGGVAVGTAGNETLGDDKPGAVGQQHDTGIAAGGGEVDKAFAVLVVGPDDLPDVDPPVFKADTIQVVADNGGGDEFAKTNGLAVVVIVCGRGERRLPLELGEKTFKVGIDRVGSISEELPDNAHVVVPCLLQEGRMLVEGVDSRHQLLKQVGGLPHGRDHNDECIVAVTAHDGGHVAHGRGTVDGGSSEFEYSHRHWHYDGLAQLPQHVALGVFLFD